MITAKVFLNDQLISCFYGRKIGPVGYNEKDFILYSYHWEYYKLIPVIENKGLSGEVYHAPEDGFESLVLLVFDNLDEHFALFMQNNIFVDKNIERLVIEFAINGALIGYTTLYIVQNPPRDKIRGEHMFLYTWEHYIPEKKLLKSETMIEFNKEKQSIEALIASVLKEIINQKSHMRD